MLAPFQGRSSCGWALGGFYSEASLPSASVSGCPILRLEPRWQRCALRREVNWVLSVIGILQQLRSTTASRTVNGWGGGLEAADTAGKAERLTAKDAGRMPCRTTHTAKCPAVPKG